MKLSVVLYEKKNDVAYITLNRPDKLNPLNSAMCDELEQCLADASLDDSVRAVFLRGAGGNFSAGGDVGDMASGLASTNDTPAILDMKPTVRAAGNIPLRIKQTPKPVVALVEGACVGAGLGMVMACDFSYVSEASKMSFAFVLRGLVPDTGVALEVARAVGVPKATELLMLGQRFSGAEAAQWGLVSKALPDEELEKATLGLVEQLAQGPTTTYSLIKSMIYQANFTRMPEFVELEADYQQICGNTSDFAESIAAFFEKRAPKLTGK